MAEDAAMPLAGTRILDLSRALAGPYASALLADLGATVIKAENLHGGDSSRAWPPFEDDHSLYFDSCNRGKESIAVDFYSQAGRELLWELALGADVVLENFRPGVLATMGLDPDVLRAANPALIVASVSGFGATGPLAQAPGLDQVAQGMSGLMSVTGPDAARMCRVGVPIVDLVAGVNTALGIAAALVARGRSGEGMEVSTSLLETGIALGAFQSQRFLSTGEVPVPQGNTHPALTPYGVFATADIPLIIAVGTEKQWRQLCELLEVPELVGRPEYATGTLRHTHEEALRDELEARLGTRSAEAWLPLLRAAAIPAGPIYNYAQVFADEQVQSLAMVETVHRADGSALPLVRGPISINRRPPRIGKAPPSLGEDTLAVLRGLSLSEEQITGLLDAGVVLAAPTHGYHNGRGPVGREPREGSDAAQ